MAFPTGQYWVCSGGAISLSDGSGLVACPAANAVDLGATLNSLQVAGLADVSSSQAVDYSVLAELWGFAFTTVLIFWLVSFVARQVLSGLFD